MVGIRPSYFRKFINRKPEKELAKKEPLWERDTFEACAAFWILVGIAILVLEIFIQPRILDSVDWIHYIFLAAVILIPVRLIKEDYLVYCKENHWQIYYSNAQRSLNVLDEAFSHDEETQEEWYKEAQTTRSELDTYYLKIAEILKHKSLAPS